MDDDDDCCGDDDVLAVCIGAWVDGASDDSGSWFECGRKCNNSSDSSNELRRVMRTGFKAFSHWVLLNRRLMINERDKRDDKNLSHNSNNGLTMFRKKSAIT